MGLLARGAELTDGFLDAGGGITFFDGYYVGLGARGHIGDLRLLYD